MIAWGQSVGEVAGAHNVSEDLARLWAAVLADRLGLSRGGLRLLDDDLVREIGQNLFFDAAAPDVVNRLTAGGDARTWAEAVRVTGDVDLVARGLGVPVIAVLDAVQPHLSGGGWDAWLREARRLHVPAPVVPLVDVAELAQPLDVDAEMVDMLQSLPPQPDDVGFANDTWVLQEIRALWVHAGLDLHEFDVVDRRSNGQLMQLCVLAYEEESHAVGPDGHAGFLAALTNRFLQLHRHFADYRSEK